MKMKTTVERIKERQSQTDEWQTACSSKPQHQCVNKQIKQPLNVEVAVEAFYSTYSLCDPPFTPRLSP